MNRGRGNYRGRGSQNRGGRGEGGSQRGGGGGGRNAGGFDYTRFIQKRETNVVTQVNLAKERCVAVRRALNELQSTSPQYFQTQESNESPVQIGNGLRFEENVARTVKQQEERGEVTAPSNYSSAQPHQPHPKMSAFREKLPAFKKRAEILDEVERSQVILVTGETGCGKTTQVPQFLLENALEINQRCRIVCTQPRRIAAIAMAERVAEERGERLGNSVGFQIRLENELPVAKQGNILFCTTGVLLRQLHSNPSLRGVTHLILDEVHERNVETDLLMGLLRNIILQHRPTMKLLLMSATLRAEQFSEYFWNCPRIHIEGFTYPVQEFYLEDVLELTQFNNYPALREGGRPNRPVWAKYTRRGKEEDAKTDQFKSFIEPFAASLSHSGKYSSLTCRSIRNPASELVNVELIAELVHEINANQGEGAILVFVCGYDQISKLNQLLINSRRDPQRSPILDVYPLHSTMPTLDQKAIFSSAPRGHRKVVLATNIAETSITIDDVVFVVDCGKHKVSDYNEQDQIGTLAEQWISLANARQRRGRAGRVMPGICYHLYSSARGYTLAEYPLPEILRERIDGTILDLKMLAVGEEKKFLSSLLTPPKEEVVCQGIEGLIRIGALQPGTENLTALGVHLARLPLDPNTAKMILMSAIFGCVDPITTVAANLSYKDAFVRPLGKEKQVDEVKRRFAGDSCSDHLMLVNVMDDWRRSGMNYGFCRNHFLNSFTLQQLENMKKQFCTNLRDMFFLADKEPDARTNNIFSGQENRNLLRSIICAGLYPNVAILKTKFSNKHGILVTVRTPEDGNVKLHPSSVNVNEKYFRSNFLVYHLKMRTTSKFLYDSTMVQPLAIVFFGDQLEVKEDRIVVAKYFE